MLTERRTAQVLVVPIFSSASNAATEHFVLEGVRVALLGLLLKWNTLYIIHARIFPVAMKSLILKQYFTIVVTC
jgi:hypothetical protein